MKSIFTVLLCLFGLMVLTTCEDNITVNLEPNPGNISGRIIPIDIQSTVVIKNGQDTYSTTTDVDGIFEFTDLTPGYYLLTASADGFGKVERSFDLNDGESSYLGDIYLADLPYPIKYINPSDGSMNVSIPSYFEIVIRFDTRIDTATIRTSVSIDPPISNEGYDFSVRNNYNYSILSLTGNFSHGQQYTVTLDTSLKTMYHESLEFPFTLSFSTEPFQIENFFFNISSYYQNYISASFNEDLTSNDYSDLVMLSPETAVIVNAHGPRLEIVPEDCWRPATDYSVTFSGNIVNKNGEALGTDQIFYFSTDPLTIVKTNPYNNKYHVAINSSIYVDLNNLVDEGTIESSIQISPGINSYQIYTNQQYGKSLFQIAPDSLLQANTEYEVTITSDLKDYYGGDFNGPYTFRFTTGND